jgi:AcrR family transcriptional regulator
MTRQPPAIAEPRPPYHHGDLARALLQAAGELIEEEGLESFTLRACARRAGVSHAAPAHHFRDRAGLLSAYAASVFRDMTVQGHERMAAAGQNPYGRLKAVGLSYVEFAVKRPGAFRLVFRCEALDKNNPALREAGDACFAMLSDVVGGLMPPGREDQTPLYSMLAWSVVHGFAHLWLEGNFAQTFGLRGAALDEQADILAGRLLDLMTPAFGKT